MNKFNMVQWIMFFYSYCFIGWCIESTIMSVDGRKLVNRGFLKLPFLPIYGFGALTILFTGLPFRSNPILVYIFSALAVTLLEFLTGIIMESLFKVKYWDYSTDSYNFKGIICVQSTLFWGFLSLILVYGLHDYVSKIILKLSAKALLITVIIISVLFITDIIFSIKAAFDIRYVLAKMTAAKAEINKLISIKVESSDKAQAAKAKLSHLSAERKKLMAKLSYQSKSLIRSHPSSTSEHFSDAYKEVKDFIDEDNN